jgi:mannitol/fructose-specific phosphotransferase system IIA component
VQPASHTPEGWANRCPVCGHDVHIEPTVPPGDAPCPCCGHLLWFNAPSMVRPASPPELEFLRGAVAVRMFSRSSKAEVLQGLIEAIASAGRISQPTVAETVAALIKREELGSTGIGRGVALPHADHPAIAEHTWAIGLVPQGIDFDSLDGRPVNRVYLLLSPKGDVQGKMRQFERGSRAIRALARDSWA